MTRARTYIIRCKTDAFSLAGILLAMMLLCACEREEPTPKKMIEMPISINLLASDVYASQAPAMRAYGDPGMTELFCLPNYLYFFVVEHKNDSTGKVLKAEKKSVDDEPGENAEEKLESWKKKWEQKTYAGTLVTEGDFVYQYTEKIIVPLDVDRKYIGRVYAVASAVDLHFSSTMVEGTSTEKDLLGLTFSFNGTEDYDSIVRYNLQNIYSTPYNYKVSDNYYGTFDTNDKVSYLNLLLYHVASKVDLMWNVAEAKRDSVKISYVAVEHMYNGPSFLFKPMENTVAAPVYASGYKMELLTSLSPGTQWNGRAYFYAIPYNNNDVDGESNPDPHYPLKLRLQKNGDSSDGSSYYSKTVKTEVPTVWTSWIRGQITINNGKYNVTP